MSDIDAMQSRIMAALERIGQGLDGLGPVTPEPQDDSEVQELRQQVADEKRTSAYLEERITQVEDHLLEARRQLEAASESDAAKAETARSEEDAARVEALQRLDSDLQALRQANEQLRENNAALREANAAGLAEPDLINKALQAELDGLRATQAADRAEMDVILAELGDIVAHSGDTSNQSASSAGVEDA